jgi:Eco29kI restriction endonuclease
MATAGEYNPLDYANLTRNNLTRNIVQELMTRGPFPLPRPHGIFPARACTRSSTTVPSGPYEPVRSPESDFPMYVGKAVPAGASIGSVRASTQAGRPLFARPAQHAQSITWSRNLELNDFRCR